MEELATLNKFILLLAFAVNFGLSLFVLARNRKKQLNRSLSGLLFFAGVWCISVLLFQNVTSLDWVLLLRRLTPLGPALMAGYFLYLSFTFPRKEISFSRRALIFLPGMIFSYLTLFSNQMVKALLITNRAKPFYGSAEFGLPYFIFTLYLLGYFLWGFYNIFVQYSKSEEKDRLPIFDMLFGVAVSALLGMVVSLVLPWVGIQQFFIYGPSFTLISLIFLSMAIFKHKMLGPVDFIGQGLPTLALIVLLIGCGIFFFTGNVNVLLPFFTTLANLGLGIFVYARGKKNPANQIFFGLTFLLAAWGLLFFLSNTTFDYQRAIFWNRMIYAVSCFIPVLALYFSYYFPYLSERMNIFRWVVPLGLAIVFAVLSLFTNLVVEKIYFVQAGTKIVFGFFHLFFAIYLISLLGYAFIYLAQKYRHSHGTYRVQILYLFFGGFLSALLAIFTNIVLPQLGNAHFTALGPSFMLILVGFVSYAIVKHRLMSIEVVLQRGTVYGIATALIMVFYTLAVVISEIFLRKVMGYGSLLITAGAALLIAFIYRPLVIKLQNLADRIFFSGRYDYQETIKKISQKITSVIRLEELTRLIINSFIDTIKVAEISFLLPDKEKEHFHSLSILVPRYKKIEIDITSPIISWLRSSKDILMRDALEEEMNRQEALGEEGKIKQRGLVEVRDEMERLGIPVWVPIIAKEDLIGIIALGNKLSGDIYTNEDLVLLSTLANQTAVALENSRLYDEVVNMRDFSEEILQSMVNGVITVDNKSRIVTFNHMAENVTGLRAIESIGKNCEEIWGNRGILTIIFENTLGKNKRYTHFESSLASPQRGMVPVSLSSTVLLDHQGKKIGALVSLQDLTEVKELEEKVRRADKLTALATMAAGMAHEIKNPLSSMKILSQLLPKKFDDPEYRKKIEEIFPREIGRIDRIVESLLGFARATALTFEKAKIQDIIEEVLKYYEDQAKAAEVRIIKNYVDLPAIEVDRGQISQVFSNLILNAIQAMPNGGQLKISTLPGKEAEGILQSIKVQVADTGHGIAEDTVKKLFDPFFTTKYGGTGLGLTITHSIVDAHQGYIDVESQLGKGTTFTVTLPVSQ